MTLCNSDRCSLAYGARCRLAYVTASRCFAGCLSISTKSWTRSWKSRLLPTFFNRDLSEKPVSIARAAPSLPPLAAPSPTLLLLLRGAHLLSAHHLRASAQLRAFSDCSTPWAPRKT